MFIDWMFDGFFVAMASVASAFPGWAVMQFVALGPDDVWEPVAYSSLFVFPVVLLSMLHANSPWAILSPRILASFVRSPVAWFFFYIESIALVALLAICTVLAMRVSPWMIWLVAPCAVVGSFFYFRLLGRLGWCLIRSARTD